MQAMEAVKKVMQNKSITPSVLCDRLRIKPNVLSQRFTQKNVSVEKLNEMLRVMDYKIVILPRDATNVNEGITIE